MAVLQTSFSLKMPDLSTVHLNVPAAVKAAWVAQSRSEGMRLTHWIVDRIEKSHELEQRNDTSRAQSLASAHETKPTVSSNCAGCVCNGLQQLGNGTDANLHAYGTCMRRTG
jgi:hypothetical protein